MTTPPPPPFSEGVAPPLVNVWISVPRVYRDKATAVNYRRAFLAFSTKMKPINLTSIA